MFEVYDCVPNYEQWCAFRKKLFAHGGRADDHGWSLADCLRGIDPGGVAPTAQPLPVLGPGGGTVDERTEHRLRRKRLKESHTYLIRHLSNRLVVEALSEAPLLGNGAAAYAWLEARCCVRPDTADLEELKQEWRDITIAKDVGVSENTIIDLGTLLDAKNAMIPNAADRFSECEAAEKTLRCIAAASRTFAESATKELNAAEGVPGQPGVRQYQLGAPAGGGARPRDRATMVAYYHAQWRSQVRAGTIPKATPTRLKKPPSAQTVDRGFQMGLAASVDAPDSQVGSSVAEGASIGPRSESPSHTLYAVAEAGLALQRGATTTTDFGIVPPHDLSTALAIVCEPCMPQTEEGGQPQTESGFSVEVAFDADGTMTVEVICDNCRGLGHMRKNCPSAKRFRSYKYVADMLTKAHQRAEERAAQRGDPRGGRRQPPRGQRLPLKTGFPRRFQPAHPSNRLTPRQQQSGPGLGRSVTFEPAEDPDESAGSAASDEKAAAPASGGRGAQPDLTRAAALLHAGVQIPTTYSLVDAGGYFEHEGAPQAPAATEPPPSAVEQGGRASTTGTDTSAHGPCTESCCSITTGVPITTAEGDVPRPRSYTSSVSIAGWCATLAALLAAVIVSFADGTRAVSQLVGAMCDRAISTGCGCVLILMLLVLCRSARSETIEATQVEMVDGYVIERAHIIGDRGWLATGGPGEATGAIPSSVLFCFDSGATCVCIPEEEAPWMFSEVLETSPMVKLQVAADTPPLNVTSIGKINSKRGGIELQCESYEVKRRATPTRVGLLVPGTSAPESCRECSPLRA